MVESSRGGREHGTRTGKRVSTLAPWARGVGGRGLALRGAKEGGKLLYGTGGGSGGTPRGRRACGSTLGIPLAAP